MKDILFLHGALGTSEMFNQLAGLLSSEFRIHLLTFSGHGNQANGADTLSMDVFADDINHYLNEHHLDQAGVFGYSMGGYAAVYSAFKYPERFTAIMTLATVFDWSPERSLKESAMLDPEKIQEKVPAFAESLKKLHGKENWKSLLHQTAGLMKDLGEHHLSEAEFRALSCPVRIALGDRDKMVSVESSYAVSQKIPKGSFLVIPETAHPFEKVDMNRLAYEISLFMKNL